MTLKALAGVRHIYAVTKKKKKSKIAVVTPSVVVSGPPQLKHI